MFLAAWRRFLRSLANLLNTLLHHKNEPNFPIFDLHQILIQDLFPNYHFDQSFHSLFLDLKINLIVLKGQNAQEYEETLDDLIYALNLLETESQVNSY